MSCDEATFAVGIERISTRRESTTKSRAMINRPG